MKLIVKNDREYFKYSFNGQSINEKLPGKVKLKNGMILDYWSEQSYGSYSDHGHSETVKRYVLMTKIPFNDQLIDIELSKLDIDSFIK